MTNKDELDKLITASESAICNADWDKVFLLGREIMRRIGFELISMPKFHGWLYVHRNEILAAANRHQREDAHDQRGE